MPVTELTFAPDCAPSDIPTSVNSAPPPRYFRVDFPSERQALFGQSLLNPYFYFYSYHHILPLYFLPRFLRQPSCQAFSTFITYSQHTQGTHTHTQNCNDGLQRWQFSVTSIKWSVGVILQLRAIWKIFGIKVGSLKKALYVEHHSFKVIIFTFCFFLCCWQINFLYPIKIKIQFFPCSKAFNGSLLPIKNSKLLNFASLINLIIMTSLFSSMLTLYYSQTGKFLNTPRLFYLVMWCWTTPPLCLACPFHLDLTSFLLGCFPAPGVWRTKGVLVISHKTL